MREQAAEEAEQQREAQPRPEEPLGCRGSRRLLGRRQAHQTRGLAWRRLGRARSARGREELRARRRERERKRGVRSPRRAHISRFCRRKSESKYVTHSGRGKSLTSTNAIPELAPPQQLGTAWSGSPSASISARFASASQPRMRTFWGRQNI